MNFRLATTCVATLLTITALSTVNAENWNQYRGPNGNGISRAANLPIEFSETKNVRWKVSIHDRGWSSPAVWGDMIWLTTARADGSELFAVCVDFETGDIIHDIKVFDVSNPKVGWPGQNTYADPTPVVEEGRVYVHYGKYGTACLDTKTGEKLWERRDFQIDHMIKPASSPMVDGDMLFLNYDGIDIQFTVALDKNTGETIWKKGRVVPSTVPSREEKLGELAKDTGKPPDHRKAYGTSTIIEHEGRRQLISPAGEVTYSYDPETGEELWHVVHEGWGWNSACRPIYANGLVYFTEGASNYMVAVDPSGTGGVTKSHVVWGTGDRMPNMSSPVVVGDLLFIMNDKGGSMTCLDAKTGERIWRNRIPGGGTHWASPLYADGKIYVTSKNGSVVVISAARELEVLAENELEAEFIASPAVVGDALLLRSETHLYCIEQK